MAKILQFKHPKEKDKIKRLNAELQYLSAYAHAAYLLRAPEAEKELHQWIEKTKIELKKLFPKL